MTTSPAASSETYPVVPERLLAYLLALLAAAAGALDAICVVQFNGVFASVVTGNLVHLGVGIAAPDGDVIAFTATAVGGYIVGVAAGSAGVGRAIGWHRRTGIVVAIELALLIGVAAGWLAADAQPDRGVTVVLLALASAAMGVQSAVAISSGPHGAATTYFTGELTSIVRSVTSMPHWFGDTAGRASRFVALVAGAIGGGLLLRFAPRWAPALPVGLVATVVVVTTVSTRVA